MRTDLRRAIEILDSGEYTCVLCKEDTIVTSTERGVKPLLDWITVQADLKEFCAADKVVGKGAAFLYVLLGVKEVYARVMSEAAIDILIKNGIQPLYDICAANIINRAGTGVCPIEQAVWHIDTPEEAIGVIRETLTQLQKPSGNAS